MTDNILEIDSLKVQFDTFEGVAEVIDNIDISVAPGESIALVGETGCGKSVTAKSILGLLPNAQYPQGEIRFKGTNLLVNSSYLAKIRGNELSLVMQDPMSALNPAYTVGNQLTDMLIYNDIHDATNLEKLKIILSRKSRNRTDFKTEIIETLEEVQIPDPERVYSSYPHELSGGMQQRILISMALLSNPDLLIADEITTALDVTTESKILDLIKTTTEKRDLSLIYITHDLGVAKEISDHIYVMYAGQIVEEIPSDQLFEKAQHPYTTGLINSVPSLTQEIGSGIPGTIPNYKMISSACRFENRCEYSHEFCKSNYPYRREFTSDHSVGCHKYTKPPKYEKHQEVYGETKETTQSIEWEDQ